MASDIKQNLVTDGTNKFSAVEFPPSEMDINDMLQTQVYNEEDMDSDEEEDYEKYEQAEFPYDSNLDGQLEANFDLSQSECGETEGGIQQEEDSVVEVALEEVSKKYGNGKVCLDMRCFSTSPKYKRRVE